MRYAGHEQKHVAPPDLDIVTNLIAKARRSAQRQHKCKLIKRPPIGWAAAVGDSTGLGHSAKMSALGMSKFQFLRSF